MNTDDLATILTQTAPPQPKLHFGPAIIMLSALSFTAILMTLGVRNDLMASMMSGGFWFKTVFLGTALILSLLMLGQSAYPVRKKTIIPYLYAGLWAGMMVGAVYQIATTAFAGVLPQWQSTTGLVCVGFVLLYGLIGQIVLIKIMQQFAPIDLAVAGRNIALASAAAGAIGYSIHCTMDNPAYIIFAYGLPTFILGFTGSKILPRFIRW